MNQVSVVYRIEKQDFVHRGKGIEIPKDRELETLAAKFNGERTSSGCYLPTQERDIQFEFDSARDATQFKAAANKLIASWPYVPVSCN